MALFLTFLYIFGFSLWHGIFLDSTILCGVCLVGYGFINKPYRAVLSSFISGSKLIKNIIKVSLMVIIWALIVLLINNSDDYQFLITFIHMLLVFLIGLLLFSYLAYSGNAENTVKLILICFFIQSLIQWAAFSIPPIKSIINFTKSEHTIQIGQSYSGMRANALAGSDFFGLSSAYAIALLLFVSKKNTILYSNRALRLLFFIVLITGTFFAGRTGYIGLIGIALYYIFSFLNNGYSFKVTLTNRKLFAIILVAAIVIALIIISVYLYQTNNSFNNLIHYTFQSIFNYSDSNSFSNTSLESLESMYFAVSFPTLIIGDGRYMEGVHYYMGTDIGYLRSILFFGIIGFALLLINQIILLRVKNGSETILKISILILLLILNLKGEVIFWGQIIMGVITLYSFQDDYYIRGEANGK